ncbi:uracil-DNA glycosylase-like [Diabrotica virgifera virgifera]|uniref:Uracil-DNA glycosylase-like domain-containing protein n=1 Tax=Diabrotica virgifera virgifera TaxID=50390 RepID=A0ABM5JW68_DIAVI|nr:uracil-DNA glycosylase-like [Diabrotica virgifera virgifera]
MAQQTVVSPDMMDNIQLFNFVVESRYTLFSNSNIPDLWKPLLGFIFRTQLEPINLIEMILRYVPPTIWFPHSDKLWSFTKFCRPEEVKVVIVGQEPSDSYATGLAFSKDVGTGIYPSTKNILEEVKSDIGEENLRREFRTDYGNLDLWAKQGVLLLNSALTNSTYITHQGIGWKYILLELIKQLQIINKKIVFMFWGKNARDLSLNVEGYEGNKLIAGHPSPNNEYNNFSDCRHFSQANEWLEQHSIKPVDWCPVPPENSS